MKLSKNRNLIVGVQVGEIRCKMIGLKPGEKPISVTVGLVRGTDGALVGSYIKEAGWPEAVVKAYEAFAEAIESNVIQEFFEEGSTEDTTEPPATAPAAEIPQL